MNIADVSFNEFCRLMRLGSVIVVNGNSYKYRIYRKNEQIFWLENTYNPPDTLQTFYSYLFSEQENGLDTDLNLISFDFTNMLQSELDELVNK
jgi:hypothetical protein